MYLGRQNIIGMTMPYGIFGVNRTYSGNKMKHVGIDKTADKGAPVRSELNSVVHRTYKDPLDLRGLGYRLRSNLRYLDSKFGGLNLYHDYYHMFGQNVKTGDYVEAGTLLGTVGNSGNCWYKENNKWLRVTEEQILDSDFSRGSHLHFQVFFEEYRNAFIEDIENCLSMEKKYFIIKQWGLYFIDPEIFFKYMNENWR